MLQISSKIDRLALLTGGASSEAAISHAGAVGVAKALRSLDIDCTVIDVLDKPALCQVLGEHKIDGVFNLVHGEFGEDGALAAMLEHYKVAHTGCGASVALLCFDKNLCKSIWRSRDLPTPDWQMLPNDANDANDANDSDMATVSVSLPAVCKPTRSGSSLGVEFVDRPADLTAAVGRCRRYGTLMLERCVSGREYSTGFIQGELLPTIELVCAGRFYDYHAKYESAATQYLPAPHIDADPAVTTVLRRAFETLDCRQWGRIDYICDANEGVQLLEINSVPGMGTHSLLPKAAALAGMGYADLVSAIAANIEATPS